MLLPSYLRGYSYAVMLLNAPLIDSKSETETSQISVSLNHLTSSKKKSGSASRFSVDYWRERLFRRTYDYGSERREIAEWYVQVQHAGRWIRLFFLDEAVLDDNIGTSTVVVSNTTGWTSTYVVDSVANCLDAPLSTVAKTIALPEVGTYKFTLVASDFSESNNPLPQRHVLVAGSSDDMLGDFRNFSLKGIGDSKTLRCSIAGDVRFFFVDEAVLGDNSGSSTVQVERVLPALSVSVASVAIGWKTDPAEKYQLQYSAALTPGSWTNLGNVIQGTGTNTVVIDSVLGQPQRFYRLTLAP